MVNTEGEYFGWAQFNLVRQAFVVYIFQDDWEEWGRAGARNRRSSLDERKSFCVDVFCSSTTRQFGGAMSLFRAAAMAAAICSHRKNTRYTCIFRRIMVFT